jgi:hypothetical protein
MTEIDGEYKVKEPEYRISLDDTETQYETLRKKVAGYARIPNRVVDIKGLNPLALALYVHIKRIAGDNGACYMSSEHLANNTGMSEGSISNFKKELVDAGLITIALKDSDHGGKPFHYITIVDVWDLDKPISPGELATSPGETKKTTIKKTTKPRVFSKNEKTRARTVAEKNEKPTIESEFDREPPPNNGHRTKEELQALTIKAIDNFQKSASLKTDSTSASEICGFLNGIPEYIRGLASAFLAGFGRTSKTKQELSFWIRSWKKQYDIGLTPKHIEAAFKQMNHDGFTIKSPESVTAIAENIKRTQRDDPYHGAAEVWDSSGRIR